MRSYSSGKELTEEIRKRANLFIGEFSDIVSEEWDQRRMGVERTPRQMIAYQLGWMDALLGFERDEQAGVEVVTPASGYKWNQLGDLYESFYERWSSHTPEQLTGSFHALTDQICAWVESLSESELYEPGQRRWASSTPSAWPLWKWIHINTVAPFTTFRTKIRKWKRVQPTQGDAKGST